MLRLPTSILACALVLGAASALQAQDVPCPAASTRLTMTSSGADPVPNLFDGSRYGIYLGRRPNAAGQQRLAALIIKDGKCLSPMWLKDPTGATTQLTVPSNFCLGGGPDTVFVVRSTQIVSVCGGATITPFAYGGQPLGIYSGNNADIVFGGSGTDYVCGGGGGDILVGGTGSEDQLYGESGMDVLQDSDGSLSWSDGGASDDAVIDDTGSGDGLVGAGGNDDLLSGCSSALMFCGSGLADEAFSPDLPPPYGVSLCEDWDTDLSC